jgi:hypothetical protein
VSLGTDYAQFPARAPAFAATPGDRIVIKRSEFGTIAVLVAATAAIVVVQQYRERERRLTPPPAIEAQTLTPSTDARLVTPTGADVAATSQSTSPLPNGP